MMEVKRPAAYYMRTTHRYLGFFLAGIMAVYALSGIVLIFRDTNIFKKERKKEAELSPGMEADAVGKKIKVRDLKFTKTEGDLKYFDQGIYNNKNRAGTIHQYGTALCFKQAHPIAQSFCKRSFVLFQYLFLR